MNNCITVKSKKGYVKIKGARLLELKESWLLSSEAKSYISRWWITNRAFGLYQTGFVSSDGTDGHYGMPTGCLCAARPVLLISELNGYKKGDCFNIGSYQFKIVSPKLAWLHKQDIGICQYDNKDRKYEDSLIHKRISRWYKKIQLINLLSLKTDSLND